MNQVDVMMLIVVVAAVVADLDELFADVNVDAKGCLASCRSSDRPAKRREGRKVEVADLKNSDGLV